MKEPNCVIQITLQSYVKSNKVSGESSSQTACTEELLISQDQAFPAVTAMLRKCGLGDYFCLYDLY